MKLTNKLYKCFNCARKKRDLAFKKGCKRCKTCAKCVIKKGICYCAFCSDCQRTHFRIRCQRCLICRSKCKCRNIKNFSYGALSDKSTSLLFPSIKLAFGVELEAANWQNFQPFKWLSSHRDSSVTSGIEYVSKPLQGDKGVTKLWEFVNRLAEDKVQFDETCGYHVHVDARSLGWMGVVSLMLIWDKLERWLKANKSIPAHRFTNKYCRPIKSRLSLEGLANFKQVKTPKEAKQVVFDWMFRYKFGTDPSKYRLLGSGEFKRKPANLAADPGHPKYHSLNIFSILYQGSVEARIWPGTGEEDLVFWPLVFVCLVQAATKYQPSNLEKYSIEYILAKELPSPVFNWIMSTKERYKT